MDARTNLDAWLRGQEHKSLLRFVTIGSVDDGKSTLVGRLLHDAHALHVDQLDAIRKATRAAATRAGASTSAIDFSWVTDGLLAEREQGITIDVAYRYFTTARRKFILADTPGHVQYTRNMATGASTADVALVLVDARLGVLAQTRRHAQIAGLLGIRHVVACVNKMDLVGFDEARFTAIRAELDAVGARVGLRSMHALPVSALLGDNVVARSTNMPWFDGAPLLEHLETVEVAAAATSALRFPVQLVLRHGGSYRSFAGRIAGGTIAVGDAIVALPSGTRTTVVGIDLGDVSVPSATAPLSIAVRLADEIDLGRGDMLVSAHEDAAPPHVSASAEANLVWMSERPLARDRTYLLKHTTRTVRATLDVVAGTDAESLEERPATTLSRNDVGRVIVHARAPLFFDAYRDNRETGAFVVIDPTTNDTIAAGMLVVPVASLEEGTRGGVVCIARETLAIAEAEAFSLARGLYEAGLVAAVVHEDAAARGAAAGILALVPAVGSKVTLDGEEVRGDLLAALLGR